MIAKITLGTRGSELARAQTSLVEKAIRRVHPNVAIETKIIATRGDNAKVVDLHSGRKGLFTAQIERALVAGEVDAAFFVIAAGNATQSATGNAPGSAAGAMVRELLQSKEEFDALEDAIDDGTDAGGS